MLHKMLILILFFLSAVLALHIPAGNTDLVARADPAPGPFSTSSRWILDANGKRFKMKCVHWVGHMEVGIPEGLQHQSIDYISAWIAKNNFNCVRLSYSIDVALNPGQTVSDSFNAAAASTGVSTNDLATLYQTVIAKNPSITSTTTVINVFEAVITSLNNAGLKVILDNHVSKASWCCSQTDGNGWFDTGSPDDNNRYFDIDNWLKGLAAMAQFAKNKPNVVGMDLRNEMRPTTRDTDNWYKYIPQGAAAIHTANPDLLIIIGGLNYAVDLGFVYDNVPDGFPYDNKVVWEFHLYLWSHYETFQDPLGASDGTLSCPLLFSDLGHATGFVLTQGKPYTGPLWLSEFGLTVGGPSGAEQKWIKCVSEYMEGNDAEWDVWTVGGDYYVRNGGVNVGESYGLLDPQWGDWRNKDFPSWLGGMWDVTQGP